MPPWHDAHLFEIFFFNCDEIKRHLFDTILYLFSVNTHLKDLRKYQTKKIARLERML